MSRCRTQGCTSSVTPVQTAFIYSWCVLKWRSSRRFLLWSWNTPAQWCIHRTGATTCWFWWDMTKAQTHQILKRLLINKPRKSWGRPGMPVTSPLLTEGTHQQHLGIKRQSPNKAERRLWGPSKSTEKELNLGSHNRGSWDHKSHTF